MAAAGVSGISRNGRRVGIFVDVERAAACVVLSETPGLSQTGIAIDRTREPMKSVVITGASSGIGRDAALYFNHLGYTVFAGVRRLGDGEHVKAMAAHPEAFVPVQLDVTKAGEVEAARATVAEQVELTGLTALVSNAGIAAMSGRASCEQCPIETQQLVMDVNFFGAVRVVQAFLPLLRASHGTIVFNTALMARTVIPFNGGYAASKCALEGWADSLRREVAPLGVKVAMIEAGYIASDLEKKQHPASDDDEQVYRLEAGVRAAMAGSSAKLANRAGASPRRVSEAMVAAVSAENPKPRRIVGLGARPIRAIGALPDRLQDRIFAAGLPRMARRA
jgi:NAD(P)-dependent dehydrogenase (short-subunit alcohol dehydrogenase family)